MASDIGYVRRRQEDSWQVGFGWQLAGRTADVFAVFDGLGGEPNGDKASRAAAGGLRAAMKATPGPDALLRTLNKDVAASRGATTAVIFMAVRGGSTFLATVGDSSAYSLTGGEPEILAPHDWNPLSGGITDQLGPYFRSGHLATLSLDSAQSILLCTDGVDEVLPAKDIVSLLDCPTDAMAAQVDSAIAAIRKAGAPDNATLVLARRAP